MAQQQTNTLILVTNHFPYGRFESFLESEMPYLSSAFDRIILIARDVTSEGMRETLGATTYRIDPTSDAREKRSVVRLYFKNAIKVIEYLADEFRWIRTHNLKLSRAIVSNLIHNLSKALITARHIEQIIASENLSGKITLYSYWLTSTAVATTFVMPNNPKVRRISRAHGGDVYEQRNTLGYLSLRKTLAKELNRIYVISADGANHLRKQLGDYSSIRVARLGTRFAGNPPQKTSSTFTVVSCSFLVGVKRIDLLIQALACIEQTPIKWVHMGDGPLEEELKKLAVDKLGAKSNVTFEFAGSMSNSAILQYYTTNYIDLFVNTSSSEGIPVSMMEAQSFGIPIIGPSIGGVPEIVVEGAGLLFPVDSNAETIAGKMMEVLSLAPNEYQHLRDGAIRNWNRHYNAADNFSTFVADISTL